MAKKIVFIGAGSQVFTRNLCRDILTFPAFQDEAFRALKKSSKVQYRKITIVFLLTFARTRSSAWKILVREKN